MTALDTNLPYMASSPTSGEPDNLYYILNLAKLHHLLHAYKRK